MALVLCAFLLASSPIVANPIHYDQQHVLSLPQQSDRLSISRAKPQASQRPLHGRFLQITDLHADPFFKAGSSTDDACHRGSGRAGSLGAASSDCDSPISLVNATFQWINDNLKDEIDFVVWTGDSARHDNDERHPRTEKQVVSLNELLVNKFFEVFGKPDDTDDPDPTNEMIIPIIPTFGNNDILPHNIFTPGSNVWTKRYASIWNKFIPEEQRHSFERGGWYSVEVIPNKLAVFSLNTLYFFQSNTVVNGCQKKSEPGYEEMEWLKVQLQLLRERGMKAILTGHVPPARTASKQDWYESCWQKYALWLRQYRDVVIVGLWGHMNIDHFMFQDANEVKALQGLEDVGGLLRDHDSEVFVQSKTMDYLEELHEEWMHLPSPPSGMSYTNPDHSMTGDQEIDALKKKKDKDKKKKGKKSKEQFLKEIGGKWAERFSLSLVSPSVVPNYYPTLRVFEYNITGLDKNDISAAEGDDLLLELEELKRTSPPSTRRIESEEDSPELSASKKKKKKKKKDDIPSPPSKSSPPGPAHSPQSLSLLSYTQYFANITQTNAFVDGSSTTSSSFGKHKDVIRFEIEYDTRNYSQKYQLADLTMRSWLDLALGIGKGHKATLSASSSADDISDQFDSDVEVEKKKKKKGKGKKKKHKKGKQNDLWLLFLKRVFVGTKDKDQLEDEFF